MAVIAGGVNPHAPQPTSLGALCRSLLGNRQLIMQMVKREVAGRYKGSVFGLMWSFLNPILMLTVYTFVFSVVFKARWGGGGDSRTQFAIVLFVGMIVHGLFAEVLNRAPGLIVGNVNFVKKVIFPLEILPVVSMGAALFHAIISLCVLLLVYFFFNGYVHWTAVFLPLVIFPLIVFTLGIAWVLASLGVFVRDVSQSIGIVMTVTLFLSPVFFPISALPLRFQHWMLLNPLTYIIEDSRNVLIYGKMPDFFSLGVYTIIAIFVMWLGFFWFQKTRKGFADVL